MFLALKALLEQGLPKKEIAQRINVDPRTVRKWAIRVEAEGGAIPRRAVVPKILDRFRERIAERVERGLSAVQIHRDLEGVDGSVPPTRAYGAW